MEAARAVLTGSLYLSLVTPEIVTGISLLALFQWIFRFLHCAARDAHGDPGARGVFVAYVVIVVSARLRTFDRALEEAAMDLGATEWQAFWRVTLPSICCRAYRGRAAGVHGLVRRLRDHQPGGGRGFRDAADGDLCDGAARREPRGERAFPR